MRFASANWSDGKADLLFNYSSGTVRSLGKRPRGDMEDDVEMMNGACVTDWRGRAQAGRDEWLVAGAGGRRTRQKSVLSTTAIQLSHLRLNKGEGEHGNNRVLA